MENLRTEVMRNLVRKSLASLLVFLVPSQLSTTMIVVFCRYHNLFILWSIIIKSEVKSYPSHLSSLYCCEKEAPIEAMWMWFFLFSHSTRSPFLTFSIFTRENHRIRSFSTVQGHQCFIQLIDFKMPNAKKFISQNVFPNFPAIYLWPKTSMS